jgi:hypothetical protein
MQLPPGLAAPVHRAKDFISGAAPIRRGNDFIPAAAVPPPAFEHPVHARRVPPGFAPPPRLIVEYLAPCFENAQYYHAQATQDESRHDAGSLYSRSRVDPDGPVHERWAKHLR